MSKQFALHYSIVPSHPEAHLYTISLNIEQPDPAGQILRMPSWIPGSYMIRDFARTVTELRAESGGQMLAVKKLDKSNWQVAPCQGSLTVTYQVYAWDLSVRTAHLDNTHAFFNGTSVFLEVVGQAEQACRVDIQRPRGPEYDTWRVATTMPGLDAGLHEFGSYQAASYDELVDHPVEMGNFTLASFEVAGVPHDIVLTGKHHADMDRLCKDLKPICETHVKLFGELPAMERYLFLVMVVGEGYGGLEHRSSTALLCSRHDLPLATQTIMTDEYRNFLGLCSHEYFHTWNVKRIKPEAYLPYDLSQEVYTQQLWAFEGITSYYDDLGMVRSGIITVESYYELLGRNMTRVWRGQGRFKQTVADSSFDTWTKFYKQDESAPNNIVSYYAKGALVALALDLTIRKHTDNQKSLDDVMLKLWQNYGKPMIGVPEKAIESIAAEIAGITLDDFFDRYLYGTEDLPFETLFSDMGILWQQLPTTTLDDQGGKFIDEPTKDQAWFGARFANDTAGVKLVHVLDDSPAQKAGLSAGDTLVAINGLKATKQNIDKLLLPYRGGDVLTTHAFRRDELMSFKVKLTDAPLTTCALTNDKDADSRQVANRNQWLKI